MDLMAVIALTEGVALLMAGVFLKLMVRELETFLETNESLLTLLEAEKNLNTAHQRVEEIQEELIKLLRREQEA